ncbi:Copper resistance protein A precursor [alpha proteobacterium BAL199]|nr:Copper resistance protein A precursor [alpha proteobacterium BAL199]
MATIVVMAAALAAAQSARAATYDITIGEITVNHSGTPKTAIAYNGETPGPTLRFKEGEDVTINVTNTLDETTSIHWHGLILPFRQDGVPGITYDGIKPGETFTYRFRIVQNGTYWFHSHSGMQEQDGAYGSIVIESAEREPFKYDRDYVVLLSDSHDDSGDRILANLKKMSDYYNRQQRTAGDFFRDVQEKGFAATLQERAGWGEMRMMATDIADVQGYTFLVNGKNDDGNWTGLFTPGERVRLRFINASAMTYFDVRIPGLDLLVVQADGNNVQPVKVEEFRIGVAETYDVIVRPTDSQAYTIFAESMARTGFARGTLSPSDGLQAEIPDQRQPPLLTMADMGMDHGSMAGMDHSKMAGMSQGSMTGMDHSKMAGMDQGSMAGMDHSKMKMGDKPDAFYAPGSGLTPTAAAGGKFLSYSDLRAQKPLYPDREATREIEIRLTGNMERYFWSINGVKYSDAEPIRLKYGERVRFKFVNETMMTHPMHLHGMWSILDTDKGKWDPIKHTVSVAPGTTLYTETEVDAPGQWAFHCHLMYHMATGMFRKVIVEGGPQSAALAN